MRSFDSIFIPELAEYARTLTRNGFRVYVFKSEITRMERGGLESCVKHLGFSRAVDARECFASVSLDGRFGGPSFNMPIKPSREHGSSMFIHGDHAPENEVLTLTNAMLYASPTGSNRLVGIHENDPSHIAHLYVEVTDASVPAVIKAELQEAKADGDERRTKVVDEP